MVDQNKSIKPVESIVLSPLNEGAEFKANSYIVFRIGASDLNMWLINDSYLSLNLSAIAGNVTYKLSAQAAGGDGANVSVGNLYIRNACNLFKSVEVLYDGKTLYSQPYNIEQNTLRMLDYGESYMEANFATYTTNQMIKNGKDYLKIMGNKTVTIADAATEGSIALANDERLISNIMIPINQLIPLFMDVTSEGFPMRCLKSQIEIRLYVADPYRYLCQYDETIKDFAPESNHVAVVNGAKKITVKDLTDFTNLLKLTKVRMYCSTYVPNPDVASLYDSKAAKGWDFKYNLWQTCLRQVSALAPESPNHLPFNVVTENTRSLMLYCHKTKYSPGIMHRPILRSLYVKFGSNQLPFQPISGDTYETPFEYKFTVDDVLDNIDKYYAESNNDFNMSYKYTPKGAALGVPSSNFVLLGANYVDGMELGANSTAWNSQYQASFTTGTVNPANSDNDLTFVFAVLTDYVMTVSDAGIETVNL